MIAHEPEPFGGIAFVSRANQAAAFERISRSSRSWRHPNVHFHYAPTHASWLNQIEIWFSILSAKSLKGGSFASVPQLVNHINSFIASHNADAKPFV